MAEHFRILVVCTANVCRSPLGERVIAARLADAAHDGLIEEHLVVVRSAGVDAEPGDPMCPQSAAVVHMAPQEHRAQRLEPAMLEDANLILTADRSHRGECARMLPSCRPRLFTIVQAAALAEVVATALEAGELPDGAPPLPHGADQRLSWLVGELDAARGSMAGMPEGYEDIEDDHGAHDHAATLVQVREAAERLATAIVAVTQSR